APVIARTRSLAAMLGVYPTPPPPARAHAWTVVRDELLLLFDVPRQLPNRVAFGFRRRAVERQVGVRHFFDLGRDLPADDGQFFARVAGGDGVSPEVPGEVGRDSRQRQEDQKRLG